MWVVSNACESRTLTLPSHTRVYKFNPAITYPSLKVLHRHVIPGLKFRTGFSSRYSFSLPCELPVDSLAASLSCHHLPGNVDLFNSPCELPVDSLAARLSCHYLPGNVDSFNSPCELPVDSIAPRLSCHHLPGNLNCHYRNRAFDLKCLL
jgi:hypothetical protein